ncbi:hypothetical protein D3C72_2440860 [compost metagenome]
MPRRHLLVLLHPARRGADLLGDIGGVERLDLEGTGTCHGATLRTLLVRFVLLKVDRWNRKARTR